MAPLSYFGHTVVLIKILLSPIYFILVSAFFSGARIIDAIFQPLWVTSEWNPYYIYGLLWCLPCCWAIFRLFVIILGILFFVPPFPVIIAVGVVLEVFLFVPQIIFFIQLWYKWTRDYSTLVGHDHFGFNGLSKGVERDLRN
jgi:hypothetical protein